jgi:hypothetical protein
MSRKDFKGGPFSLVGKRGHTHTTVIARSKTTKQSPVQVIGRLLGATDVRSSSVPGPVQRLSRVLNSLDRNDLAAEQLTTGTDESRRAEHIRGTRMNCITLIFRSNLQARRFVGKQLDSGTSGDCFVPLLAGSAMKISGRRKLRDCPGPDYLGRDSPGALE